MVRRQVHLVQVSPCPVPTLFPRNACTLHPHDSDPLHHCHGVHHRQPSAAPIATALMISQLSPTPGSSYTYAPGADKQCICEPDRCGSSTADPPPKSIQRACSSSSPGCWGCRYVCILIWITTASIGTLHIVGPARSRTTRAADDSLLISHQLSFLFERIYPAIIHTTNLSDAMGPYGTQ